jgi:hypothetical protein
MGTSFLMSDDSLGRFLITCRHVIQIDSGRFADSIFLRLNKRISGDRFTSDTTRLVILLRDGNTVWYALHPDSNIDLVAIPLIVGSNTGSESARSLPALRTKVLLSREEFESSDITEGTEIELIGFAISSTLFDRSQYHYPFSRFGRIGLYPGLPFPVRIDQNIRIANFILLDMVLRPGDSGAPILAMLGSSTRLIGFAAATSNSMEYGVAYPIYYVYDLIESLKASAANVSQHGRE